MPGPILTAAVERWPLAAPFTISRGSKTEAAVIVVTVRSDGYLGRGECVPYGRYGESIEGVMADIEAQSEALKMGAGRTDLLGIMPPGAARNAIDCALWDLEAKMSGGSAADVAGIQGLKPVTTAYTISLGPAETMAREAAKLSATYPLLKLKLGGEGDGERLRAVRAAAPEARLIVDANEAWQPENLGALIAAAREAGVELIEQPVAAGGDACLADVDHSVPICADESLHDRSDLDRLPGLYDAVNIKLDKAGGLTEALDLAREARSRGLRVLVGCMVSTSLAIAPAVLLAQAADWGDLDGPLLLARDRTPGLRFAGATVAPPEPALWG